METKLPTQLAAENLALAKEKGFSVTQDSDLVLYHGTRKSAAILKSKELRAESWLATSPEVSERFAHTAAGNTRVEVFKLQVSPSLGVLRADGYFVAREPIPLRELPYRESRGQYAAHLTGDLRLFIDDEHVTDFPGGRQGETLARKASKAAIKNGAAIASIYKLGDGFKKKGDGVDSHWKLLSTIKQKEPKVFFRDAGDDMIRDGQPLKLPERKYAERVLDSVFGAPRGTNYLRGLTDHMKPGDTQTGNVRGTFSIGIKSNRLGKLSYAIAPLPDKTEQLGDILRTAANREPDHIAKTPYHVHSNRGRTRGMAR